MGLRASLQNLVSNAIRDPLRRLMDRILRQMGVACCGLDIAVAQQLADHRQDLAEGLGAGRAAVPEVVNSHVVQMGRTRMRWEGH